MFSLSRQDTPAKLSVYSFTLSTLVPLAKDRFTLASLLNVIAPPTHHGYPLLEVVGAVKGEADLAFIDMCQCSLNDMRGKALI